MKGVVSLGRSPKTTERRPTHRAAVQNHVELGLPRSAMPKLVSSLETDVNEDLHEKPACGVASTALALDRGA